MRRFLLVLTFITFAAWSQPAQQQAQPPIVINNQMPREAFWTGLLKLAIPTIVAAALASGITLYGVNKTHKHQAIENEASRKHQLQVEIAKAKIAAEHRSQDRRWEFRKDVYVNLITALETILWQHRHAVACMDINQPVPPEYLTTNFEAIKAISVASNLAPLAMSETVLSIVNDTLNSLPPDTSDTREWFRKQNAVFSTLITALQAAGRKDLWGTPETEVKSSAQPQA